MTELDAERLLRHIPSVPGVYQMLAADGEVLYVGKARDLAKRVGSYFQRRGLPPKTRALMQRVADIDVIRTHTETEALLLENNLIKRHRPRYNIVLRDDKSYPYIHLDDSHPFPRIGFYRGSRREPGRFFGPYAGAGAVREILALLQKIFPVRQCEDSFFRTRSRPCLQYQIRRCTAPCVGLIEREQYLDDVKQAVLFLEGKDQRLNDYLMEAMENASDRLDFEVAAKLRDRLRALRCVQEQQHVSKGSSNLDVVALRSEHSHACIDVVFVRGGRHSGNKAFFPDIALESEPAEVIAAFLGQFYLDKPIPDEVLVNPAPMDKNLLAESLSQRAGRKVRLVANPRGHRARLVEHALINAEQRLRQHLAGRATQLQRLESLRQSLDLTETPQRIECFDASHTAGEATVVSCVVFDDAGPIKSDYRRYNIRAVTGGDDYAALEEALQRRYAKLKTGEGKLPDLILIDGGKGQLSTALSVLSEMQIDDIPIAAVAKGSTRKPGLERLFLPGRSRALILPADSVALHLIQQVRDEAHRFAVTSHRQRRGKALTQSRLEEIPGVGSKRRQALLRHLGGWQEVARAGIEDLTGVPGISPNLAERIYAYFHGD